MKDIQHDKKLPLVSIIMPVYNAEKYLETCLDSILEQTYYNWELITIDDFSTDHSKEILEKYALNDSRIKYSSNLSKGIIPALKMAFSQTKGNFITRMDADDIMPPQKLENLRKTLIDIGTKNIVTGKVKYFSESQLGGGYLKYEKWLNNLCEHQNHFEHIYKECVVPSACWMAFRADLLAINAFEISEYPEDYDLVFRFYEAGYKIHGMNQVLHLWRDHASRASRNDPNYDDQNFFHLKIKYFLKLDYEKNKTLILWGAGKKGKAIAQILIKANVVFIWVTNNKKKIGANIYGVFIQNFTILNHIPSKQIILSIADQSFVEQKQNIFKEYGLEIEEIFEF